MLDYAGYDLLQGDDLPNPKVFIADKGHDSNEIRRDVENKADVAVIPGRSNRKEQPFLDPFVYALRNQIERCFNNSRMPDAWQLDTTKPPEAIWLHSDHFSKALGKAVCPNEPWWPGRASIPLECRLMPAASRIAQLQDMTAIRPDFHLWHPIREKHYRAAKVSIVRRAGSKFPLRAQTYRLKFCIFRTFSNARSEITTQSRHSLFRLGRLLTGSH